MIRSSQFIISIGICTVLCVILKSRNVRTVIWREQFGLSFMHIVHVVCARAVFPLFFFFY